MKTLVFGLTMASLLLLPSNGDAARRSTRNKKKVAISKQFEYFWFPHAKASGISLTVSPPSIIGTANNLYPFSFTASDIDTFYRVEGTSLIYADRYNTNASATLLYPSSLVTVAQTGTTVSSSNGDVTHHMTCGTLANGIALITIFVHDGDDNEKVHDDSVANGIPVFIGL
jgi:hypothetical protein